VNQDENGRWSSRVNIDAVRMQSYLQNWLKPTCSNLTKLLVDRPLQILPNQDVLGSVISDTAGSLCNDMWWRAPPTMDPSRIRYHMNGPGPDYPFGAFASARQVGQGYVVAITGIVSPDYLTSLCQDNIVWIGNLIQHFHEASRKAVDEDSFIIFREARIFLSHRTIDKPAVRAIGEALEMRGPRVWLDVERMLPSDPLGTSISRGLEECSHFALFWSEHCVGAPWVELEVGSAITAMVEQKKPLFVVALDKTPVPALIAQIIRIDGTLPADEVARTLTDTIRSLRRRA
jgi:hypothetical protein